jgi:hypothetical protein
MLFDRSPYRRVFASYLPMAFGSLGKPQEPLKVSRYCCDHAYQTDQKPRWNLVPSEAKTVVPTIAANAEAGIPM